jgi:hypothetical protein
VFGVVTSLSQLMKRSLRCRCLDVVLLATSSARVLLELLLDLLNVDGSRVRSSSTVLAISTSTSSASGLYLRCCHGSGREDDNVNRDRAARLLLRLTMVPKASRLTTTSGSRTAPIAMVEKCSWGLEAASCLRSGA